MGPVLSTIVEEVSIEREIELHHCGMDKFCCNRVSECVCVCMSVICKLLDVV